MSQQSTNQSLSAADAAKNQDNQNDLSAKIAELQSIIAGLGYVNDDHAKLKAKKSRLDSVKEAEYAKLKEVYSQDVSKLSSMLEQGKITKEQAVELAQKLKSAFESKITELDNAIGTYSDEILSGINSIVIDNFKQSNADFFNDETNNQVVEAFTKKYGHVSQEDLDFIASTIANIKNKNSKSVPDIAAGSDADKSNKEAISKLVCSIDVPSAQSGAGIKVFTLADIKKMSNSEFKKYEKSIFEQLKAGLIK